MRSCLLVTLRSAQDELLRNVKHRAGGGEYGLDGDALDLQRVSLAETEVERPPGHGGDIQAALGPQASVGVDALGDYLQENRRKNNWEHISEKNK